MSSSCNSFDFHLYTRPSMPASSPSLSPPSLFFFKNYRIKIQSQGPFQNNYFVVLQTFGTIYLAPGWQKLAVFQQTQEWLQFFVRRVFTIFATNVSFLCVTANFIQFNMQYIRCNSALLAQETLFLTPKSTYLAQRISKSA